MNVGGLPADARAQYRIHKMMLQQFQYQRPKKYWVLKGFHGSACRNSLRPIRMRR